MLQKKDVTFYMTGYYLNMYKAYACVILVFLWLNITLNYNSQYLKTMRKCV